MGREWYYWGRSLKKGNVVEEKKHSVATATTAAPAGCMSGVFQLFDLHHVLFTTRTVGGTPFPTGRPLDDFSAFKGVEAPRNSLELDGAGTTASSASVFDDDFEIPYGIQVVPRRKLTLEEQEEEERSSLEGSSTARTRNVVAKLMGLDALPNQNMTSFSPRSYYGCQHQDASLSPLPHSTVSHSIGKKMVKGQRMDSSTKRGSQTPPPRHPLQPRSSNVMTEDDAAARRGTRSLPDTPRVSLARRSWDSDPRINNGSNKENVALIARRSWDSNSGSNHSNKENLTASGLRELKCATAGYAVSISPPLVKTKSKEWKHHLDESKSVSSPSHYAREIVRQVKDSVNRRIERSRAKGSAPAEQTRSRSTPPPQCSPRLNPPESPKYSNNLTLVPEPDHDRTPPRPPEPKSTPVIKPRPKPQQPPPISSPLPLKDEGSKRPRTMPIDKPTKCKRASFERFTERLKKPNPSAAAQLPIKDQSSSPPSLLSLMAATQQEKQQHPPPSPPAARIEDHQQQPKKPVPPEPQDELQYVKRVLEKAGVRGNTALPFAVRWHTPSHPLDPALFNQLELSSPDHHQHRGSFRLSCNRKLLFDVVDEQLSELLWHFLAPTPLSTARRARQQHRQQQRLEVTGESLLRQLLSRIRSFPAASCHVIQDIDALVDGDLPDSNVRRLLHHPAVADEAESIAAECERSVLDALLAETAAALLG